MKKLNVAKLNQLSVELAILKIKLEAEIRNCQNEHYGIIRLSADIANASNGLTQIVMDLELRDAEMEAARGD